MSYLKAVWNKLKPGHFDHSVAQAYEAEHARGWIADNFKALNDQIVLAAAAGKRWAGPDEIIVKEFFGGSMERWASFADFISDRACLDVGCGPCSVLCIWHWVRTRMVIDPLADQYHAMLQELHGASWYSDDVTRYSLNAEEPIPALEGKIDGAIICRNALDHCDRPYRVLDNLAGYAASGCRLLLWTDLYHRHGTDAGHTNITTSPEEFEAYIHGIGFDVMHRVGDIRGDGSTINYGCLAVKR